MNDQHMQKRRREIQELAVKEAASHQATEDLAKVYQNLVVQEDDISIRIRTIEEELKRRYLEEMPVHTPVKIRGLEYEGRSGFIGGVAYLYPGGEPAWRVMKARKDGTESVFKFDRTFSSGDLELDRGQP